MGRGDITDKHVLLFVAVHFNWYQHFVLSSPGIKSVYGGDRADHRIISHIHDGKGSAVMIQRLVLEPVHN